MYVCLRCRKDFSKQDHPGYFYLFDKCRGKTCPDCGLTRKLGKIKCLHEDFGEPNVKSLFECSRCHVSNSYFFNGICLDCFCEIQKKKKSCVCPLIADKTYYCSLCDECHGPQFSIVCKNCMKKQEELIERRGGYNQKKMFLWIGLSILSGIIIGFLLCWLLLSVNKKLHTKKPH